MQYHHRYKKENFPLAEFHIDSISLSMLSLLKFIIRETDYVVCGGAACNILLNTHNKLKDLDIFIHMNFRISLQPFLDLHSTHVFWDKNFFGQEKCAIFFKKNNLFHKIELTFCDSLPPTVNHQVNVGGELFMIHVATPDWLLFDKLEKISRKRHEPIPNDKFKNHVSSCISLARILHYSISNFTLSEKNASLAREALIKTKKFVDPLLAYELSQALVKLGLIKAIK